MTALAPCGTVAAYRRHQRHGETPCNACREAMAAAARDRRAGLPAGPGRGGWERDEADLAPCGTAAAAKRRQRHGEPVDYACKVAASYYYAANKARQRGEPAPDFTEVATRIPDTRAPRNGLPFTPGYVWRARRYPWAERAIARAEAIHGQPEEAA